MGSADVRQHGGRTADQNCLEVLILRGFRRRKWKAGGPDGAGNFKGAVGELAGDSIIVADGRVDSPMNQVLFHLSD
jgi:hypothetical protein